MYVIDHPKRYRTGTRVLFLKGRHKDGIQDARMVMRISHDVDQFECALAELCSNRREGERIYASAGSRSLSKAIRIFKERQLAAEYDDQPEWFYHNIENCWVSCLMSPKAQVEKLWLFDCDTEQENEAVKNELAGHYGRQPAPYRYESKSGAHIIVAPFNRTHLSNDVRALIHENPLMLWAY